MKNKATVLLGLLVFIIFCAPVSATTQIIIDGKINFCETLTDKESNTTLVPLRFISESLGYKVNWDGKDRITTLGKDYSIVLYLNQKEAKIGKKTVFLTVPPKIVTHTTYVPLRFISEGFGSKVTWNPKTKQIIIGEIATVMPQPLEDIIKNLGSSIHSVYFKALKMDGDAITAKATFEKLLSLNEEEYKTLMKTGSINLLGDTFKLSPSLNRGNNIAVTSKGDTYFISKTPGFAMGVNDTSVHTDKNSYYLQHEFSFGPVFRPIVKDIPIRINQNILVKRITSITTKFQEMPYQDFLSNDENKYYNGKITNISFEILKDSQGNLILKQIYMP